MRSSGVPEQPVNIQYFMGVLVGARNGQRILKSLKSYTQMYGDLIQVSSDAYMCCNFLTHILLHTKYETFHRFFSKWLVLDSCMGEFFVSCAEAEGYSRLLSD